MITIDCSIGEGSPVRIAAGLSAATDSPVHLKNIFANRNVSGITSQQLAGVRAVAELTNAETEGLERGSTELVFRPDGITTRSVTAEIPDSGGVPLAIQPLMIAATAAEDPVTVRIEGGATAVERAPTIHYLEHVVLPVLKRHGYECTIKVERHGFAPNGGAVVEATFDGSDMGWIDCMERGSVEMVRGISWASNDIAAESVAERQRMAARKAIQKRFPDAVDVSIDTAYVDADGTGCAVQLWAETEESRIGGAGIGDGSDAETVGDDAGEALVHALLTEDPLDVHMSDQIVPFLGLTGGNVRVRDFTDRVISNIAVTKAFTPYTVGMEPDRNCITIS